jgi:hypothetical protein
MATATAAPMVMTNSAAATRLVIPRDFESDFIEVSSGGRPYCASGRSGMEDAAAANLVHGISSPESRIPNPQSRIPNPAERLASDAAFSHDQSAGASSGPCQQT